MFVFTTVYSTIIIATFRFEIDFIYFFVFAIVCSKHLTNNWCKDCIKIAVQNQQKSWTKFLMCMTESVSFFIACDKLMHIFISWPQTYIIMNDNIHVSTSCTCTDVQRVYIRHMYIHQYHVIQIHIFHTMCVIIYYVCEIILYGPEWKQNHT